MADGWLLPALGEDDGPFWEGARSGELRVQQCPATGRLLFPPRARSPWAPHAEPRWVAVSGRGSIWSFAVPHPPLLEPFAELAPYNVVLVALEEDPRVRLVGNLLARPGGALNELEPRSIEIGARVRVHFERVSEAIYLPRWIANR